MSINLPADGRNNAIPFVKHYQAKGKQFQLKSVSFQIADTSLENEREILTELLSDRKVEVSPDGLPVKLEITELELPVRESRYRKELNRQGYILNINSEEILIQSPSAAGVFYGIQTLTMIPDQDNNLQEAEIKDWPDLPRRMIMVDPSRQNENLGYYKRMLDFCGRYKINFLHVHLTDDQTSCLYHPDYPELMHQAPWTQEIVKEMTAYAGRYHIELIAEIESLGHSRMFTRLPDATDYLHQTEQKESEGWVRIDIPGHTNILCPASDKALDYLEKMYCLTELFPYPELHIGLDEVGLTKCRRCLDKFGEISKEEWFKKHLIKCRDMVLKSGRKAGIWSDMLLNHPEIMDGLDPKNTIIYDWHYTADVDPKSVELFLEKGFEVIAAPALVCWPHVIMPNDVNFENIRRFAEIARDKDLLGIDTTVWIPQRYMSDILWTGLAFAAVQSWSGSNYDENAFYKGFMLDYFGSTKGEEFGKLWKKLQASIWNQMEFRSCTWFEMEGPDGIEEARKLLDKKVQDKVIPDQDNNDKIVAYIDELYDLSHELMQLFIGIDKNMAKWQVIYLSCIIHNYSIIHLMSVQYLKDDGSWNREGIKQADEQCMGISKMIEADWDRNRFADDPNKDGLYQPHEHLLHRFRKMHEFHQELLKKK